MSAACGTRKHANISRCASHEWDWWCVQLADIFGATYFENSRASNQTQGNVSCH